MTKLTANKIAVSTYAQCDPKGNEYQLLADIVDHKSNDKALRLADQKVE